MAGIPTPTQPLLMPFGAEAPPCTQTFPHPGGKTLPFPVTAADVLEDGGACLDTGFPAVDMTDVNDGGYPPFGTDINGILYLISAWLGNLTAGQMPTFNAQLATAMNGYALGALLAKANGVGVWFNTVAGNTTDPDGSMAAGWINWMAVGEDYMSALLPAGTTNNWSPTGFSPSIGMLDVDTSAGAASLGGLVPGLDGQEVIISNVNSSNSLTLLALSSGSSPANRFRSAQDVILKPNGSVDVRYSAGVNMWLVIP